MALDLNNTKDVYTAMFNGKSNRDGTFADVWAPLEEIIKADSKFTIKDINVEEGTVAITTPRGDIHIERAPQQNHKFNVKLSTNTEEDNAKLKFLSATRLADELVDYIQRNKSIAQTSGAQVLRR